MSTTDRAQAVAVPPLVDGDRLDAATFHDRYGAMPASTRAELVGGVVSMPSPVSPDHGRGTYKVAVWLGLYELKTPGLVGEENTSTRLDDDDEVQPDVNLRIRPEYGGQSGTTAGYIDGAPELVVEVAGSSRKFDLGPKLAEYERAGVREYLVLALEPDEVLWHVLRGGRYDRLGPGADGLYRSEVFPGLWLDPAALLAGDLPRLAAAVELGVASPEHAAFVRRLEQARAGRAG